MQWTQAFMYDVSSLMWKFSSSVLCREMKQQRYREMFPLQASVRQQQYVFACEDGWQSNVLVWFTAVEIYLLFLSISSQSTLRRI